MTIENAVQNSVKIKGLDTQQAQISDMFPADWNIHEFKENGPLNSGIAISNNQDAMLMHALVYEHDGAVYVYTPTSESVKPYGDRVIDENVQATLEDETRCTNARWITQAALLQLDKQKH